MPNRGLRPSALSIVPIIALTALPGVSFIRGSLGNFESISPLNPFCSNMAMARAEAAKASSSAHYPAFSEPCSAVISRPKTRIHRRGTLCLWNLAIIIGLCPIYIAKNINSRRSIYLPVRSVTIAVAMRRVPEMLEKCRIRDRFLPRILRKSMILHEKLIHLRCAEFTLYVRRFTLIIRLKFYIDFAGYAVDMPDIPAVAFVFAL